MDNTRLTGTDSIQDAFVKMSDGNPGALMTLMAIYKAGKDVDPDNAFGGLGHILFLDTLGIYGTDVYILHNDLCDRDVHKTIGVIRAVQLGLFDGKILQDACSRQDRSGKKMVPVNDLCEQVKARLINFKLS